jgi:hypothetical protein
VICKPPKVPLSLQAAEGPVEPHFTRGCRDVDAADVGYLGAHPQRLAEVAQQPHKPLAALFDHQPVTDQLDVDVCQQVLGTLELDDRLAAGDARHIDLAGGDLHFEPDWLGCLKAVF